MKSKVHIKSHPVHPILVGFPVAFFVLTLIMDALMLLQNQPFFGEMAYYLELSGIVAAVAAAIPGIIDYTFAVPPDSSAKKRGAIHGLLNVTMLLVFITAFLLRKGSGMGLILSLETCGLILLGIAGWMGGTLVHRNQIGIDHRYANAGKWKEEVLSPGKENKVELKDLAGLKTDQMKLVRVNGKRIVIGRTEKEYLAFDDHCTHRGGSLADGVMICGTVQCPWHGSQFNVQSGKVNAGPAKRGIKTYAIEVSGNKHYLKL